MEFGLSEMKDLGVSHEALEINVEFTENLQISSRFLSYSVFQIAWKKLHSFIGNNIHIVAKAEISAAF